MRAGHAAALFSLTFPRGSWTRDLHASANGEFRPSSADWSWNWASLYSPLGTCELSSENALESLVLCHTVALCFGFLVCYANLALLPSGHSVQLFWAIRSNSLLTVLFLYSVPDEWWTPERHIREPWSKQWAQWAQQGRYPCFPRVDLGANAQPSCVARLFAEGLCFCSVEVAVCC